MIDWCPRCQRLTPQKVEETEIVKMVSCLQCHTLLFRKWKVIKKGALNE